MMGKNIIKFILLLNINKNHDLKIKIIICVFIKTVFENLTEKLKSQFKVGSISKKNLM